MLHQSNINRYGYQPLLTDTTAPIFSMRSNAYFVSFQHFLHINKPIVLFFLNASQQSKGQLSLIETINHQLHAHKIQALFLFGNPTKKICKTLDALKGIHWFADDHNEIAEKFGLFNLDNPVANWLSGVDDEEAILPAAFAIMPNRKISYSFTDYEGYLFQDADYTQRIIQNAAEAIFRQQPKQCYLLGEKRKLA